jgi:hypothetical protein
MVSRWSLQTSKKNIRNTALLQTVKNQDFLQFFLWSNAYLDQRGAKTIFSKYTFLILHFLVDLDNEEVSERQPAYSRHSNWTAEASFEFLEPRASHSFFRAFYVPLLSRRYCRWEQRESEKSKGQVVCVILFFWRLVFAGSLECRAETVVKFRQWYTETEIMAVDLNTGSYF